MSYDFKTTLKRHFLLIFIYFTFGLLPKRLIAQGSLLKDSLKGHVAINYYGAADNLPFWLQANQFSTIPRQSSISLNGKISYEAFISSKKHWKFISGAQLFANQKGDNKLLISDYIGGIQYNKLQLYIGRKQESMGLVDTTLTSGSYIWSGNALPIPKIQIEISDYLSLSSKIPWLSIKGNFAHGWFGAGDFAYGYYLHQKSLYTKIGKPTSQLKLFGGFNHQVQWGGKTYGDIGTVNNKTLPGSFSDYLLVVTGSLFGKKGGGNAFDSTNRVGNHLGTLDIGAEFEFRRSTLSIYRQSLYDDGSLARKKTNNIADGLQGIVLKFLYPEREKGRLSLKKVLFEFLYTKSQGGSTFDFEGGIFGRDNYFNHQQYFDGWSYKRRIIGTPFITNYRDTNNSDDYNSNEIANNNRVVVYHFGFEGYFGEKLHFLSKLSYSLNYGTYGFPYESVPKQFSGLLQVDGQIGLWEGLEWNAAIALDQGQLYTNTLGGKIGIRKTWSGKK